MRGCIARLFALPFAAAPAAARDLTVVAGGGALQDDMRRVLFDPFARASGAPVLDQSYDGNIGPVRAMVQARNVTSDVVLVEVPDLQRLLRTICRHGFAHHAAMTAWNAKMARPGSFMPGSVVSHKPIAATVSAAVWGMMARTTS